MFLTERWAAWQREGVPFHLWLTSPLSFIRATSHHPASTEKTSPVPARITDTVPPSPNTAFDSDLFDNEGICINVITNKCRRVALHPEHELLSSFPFAINRLVSQRDECA
jgi:hypothetical protein